MADNNNAEAVRFANEKIRVLADTLKTAYLTAKTVAAEWTANNLGTIFPLDDLVIDGSATDGRHPITGNDVTLLITRANELVTDYEATSNAKLNTILNVAVNGGTAA